MTDILALPEEARDYIGKVTPHDGPYELANSLDAAIAELREQKVHSWYCDDKHLPAHMERFYGAGFGGSTDTKPPPIGNWIPLYASPVAPVEQPNRCPHGVWAADHCYKCQNSGYNSQSAAPTKPEQPK